MEDDGHAPLLAEACRADLLRFAEHDRSFGNDDVLVVVRINGIRNENLDRAGGIAVQAIHQNRVQNRTLIDHIRLPDSRIDVGLQRALVILLSVACGSPGCARRNQAAEFCLQR